MVRRVMSVGALLVACSVVVFAAATIRVFRLQDGYEEANTIGSTLYDASGVGPVVFTDMSSAYDRKALLVRKGNRTAPEYFLAETIDLAAAFSQALRSESQAMGFRPMGTGWQVSGSIREIYLESHQVYMGATLFYGYIDVEFTVVAPRGGAPKTVPMRLHCYHGAYKQRLNRQQEAREGLAHLVVEGAQEAVARLNRAYFEAPPTGAMVRIGSTLRRPSANDLHLVGLSGAREAVQPLLKLLVDTDDENVRFDIIAALGRIGAAEAMPLLEKRYKDEDEDCRWATLKALDYIGGEKALTLAQKLGRGDDFYPCDHIVKRMQ